MRALLLRDSLFETCPSHIHRLKHCCRSVEMGQKKACSLLDKMMRNVCIVLLKSNCSFKLVYSRLYYFYYFIFCSFLFSCTHSSSVLFYTILCWSNHLVSYFLFYFILPLSPPPPPHLVGTVIFCSAALMLAYSILLCIISIVSYSVLFYSAVLILFICCRFLFSVLLDWSSSILFYYSQVI